MLDFFKRIFKGSSFGTTSTTIIKPSTTLKGWKLGMWVVTNTQIGILYSLTPLTVHLVDKVTGETIQEIYPLLDSLRQATYDEIPACRRQITKEKAMELGYGS